MNPTQQMHSREEMGREETQVQRDTILVQGGVTLLGGSATGEGLQPSDRDYFGLSGSEPMFPQEPGGYNLTFSAYGHQKGDYLRRIRRHWLQVRIPLLRIYLLLKERIQGSPVSVGCVSQTLSYISLSDPRTPAQLGPGFLGLW